MNYVIAIYEIGRSFGGPEEGGWWFDTGVLERVIRVVHNEDRAYEIARRANRLLDRQAKANRCDVGSVAYRGGAYGAYVYEKTAPEHFPAVRPHYE